MRRTEIIEHFSNFQVRCLPSFRALCNALKALSIQVAVDALKTTNKGRISVCDLACGKGGDICKWMQHRPRLFIGIDGSETCINEASRRHSNLLATGQCCMEASFVCQDICDVNQTLHINNESIDIVSCNFFLQFACESREVFVKVIGDIHRICRPGGLFVAIIPDGDRALSLLSKNMTHIINFGHFKLRKNSCHCDLHESQAYGYAYDFALNDVFCTEYILPPKLLDIELNVNGFLPYFEDKFYSCPAQNFFKENLAHRNLITGVLKDKFLTEIDWLSLGFFRVFVAKKPLRIENGM